MLDYDCLTNAQAAYFLCGAKTQLDIVPLLPARRTPGQHAGRGNDMRQAKR